MDLQIHMNSLGRAFFHHGERRSRNDCWSMLGELARARKSLAAEASPLQAEPAPPQQRRLAATAELLHKELSARENVMMEASCY